MESKSNQSPLIVIVGETASGKSALAIELAQIFDGEIIAADSRTVYKGLDIVTAKPNETERAMIPHHLLDVVSPDSFFSAAEFKMLANRAMKAVASRGHVPIMVGGTGLYVDAVIYDFEFQDKADPAMREALQKLSVEELQHRLQQKGISLPKNNRNPRHLIRAIETDGQIGDRHELRSNTMVLGLVSDREELRAKIEHRVDAMIDAGLLDEIREAIKRFGWDAPGLYAPGFKAFREYFEGKLTLEEAKENLVHEHLRLAKRQRTWFRRNKDISWICKKAEAVDLITTFLNK